MGSQNIATILYAFSLGGVNFNDYSQIKMLTLDSNTTNNFKTLHLAGVDYEVPVDKAFIAFLALIYNADAGMVGRIGESDTADNTITKDVIKASNGTDKPSMETIIGIYAAGKYVTASDYLKDGCVLYGIEVDA